MTVGSGSVHHRDADRRSKVCSARQAIDLIADGATVAVTGSGGGLLEPDLLIETLGQRYRETGHPKDLTLVHSFGLGDRKDRGLTPIALPGLLRRVIGGHWGQTRAMAELAEQNLVEAYNLPLGVMTLLHRELAGGRPGLLTQVGIGTYVDPRFEGGRLNDRTVEDIVEVVTLGGKELLWYKPYRIDVALVRGSEADSDGYVGMAEEGFYLDALSLAGAAHGSGGVVIAQVKHVVPVQSLLPKQVKIPGPMVDWVVEHPRQWQSYASEYNPVHAGASRMEAGQLVEEFPLGVRKVIARRAALELRPGDVANLGVGVPDGVGAVLAEESCDHLVTLTFEHGIFGGVSAQGVIFGAGQNHRAVVDTADAIDFYHAGGLDAAFLGFAEVDRSGDVNVSKYNGIVMGSGGFTDIAQCAKLVVFCGTLTAGGFDGQVAGGRVVVRAEGSVRKLVDRVGQVTFSGKTALGEGHRVQLVTERAVLELGPEGWRVVELARGQRLDDLRALADFPLVAARQVAEMPAALFAERLMGLADMWSGASAREGGADRETGVHRANIVSSE